MLLTVSDLERALTEVGLEAPVRADEATESTNDTARAMAEGGAPEWSVAAAGHQTKGRGRLGRSWDDAPGRSLLFSIVLRPTWLPPPSVGLLPLLAGMSMATALRAEAGIEAGCKWPNDLLVSDRKVGGILVESRMDAGLVTFAVAGVGVNLDPPSSVQDAGGIGDADVVALFTAFLREFRGGYEGDPVAFSDRVVSAYEILCVTIGREVEATRIEGDPVRGRATAVARDGSLLLDTPQGRASVAFGEVTHLG